MKRPRILMADDHTLLLQGIAKLIEPEVELVGTAEDGRSLLTAAQKLKPDVILLDISMPLLNGIEAARRLKKTLPEVKLIFLTMHTNPAYVTEAFRVGASGYLVKSSDGSELVSAIREVMKGRSYVTPLVTRDMLDSVLTPSRRSKAKAVPGNLTPRQREVLQLVAEGRSTKEIAKLLDVSVRTVEFHKSCMMQQMGIRTTAELIKYALARGVIAL